MALGRPLSNTLYVNKYFLKLSYYNVKPPSLSIILQWTIYMIQVPVAIITTYNISGVIYILCETVSNIVIFLGIVSLVIVWITLLLPMLPISGIFYSQLYRLRMIPYFLVILNIH